MYIAAVAVLLDFSHTRTPPSLPPPFRLACIFPRSVRSFTRGLGGRPILQNLRCEIEETQRKRPLIDRR